MNEQLIVKNFGPIKDATVDFKKVTVFIGPTGGGKSTLAKLAAIYKSGNLSINKDNVIDSNESLRNYGLDNFTSEKSFITWKNHSNGPVNIIPATRMSIISPDNMDLTENSISKMLNDIFEDKKNFPENMSVEDINNFKNTVLESSLASARDAINKKIKDYVSSSSTTYIPTERIFISGLEYSWPGLMRDDIGLSKTTLDFANNFSLSRKEIYTLELPFFNATYLHINGRDFIKIPEREEPIMLLEAASGIQSTTPLLVLLEHLTSNRKHAQSFIIEEPELNLFPLTQFAFIKVLINKCAKIGEINDLVLTTHSPYVLTALNLMCYAYLIAQQDEATAKKVAKLIPRECWIDPEQFAAYYVDLPGTKKKQQVRSIINKKTGLIEENELDTASLELGDIFNKLVRLRQPAKSVARAK